MDLILPQGNWTVLPQLDNHSRAQTPVLELPVSAAAPPGGAAVVQALASLSDALLLGKVCSNTNIAATIFVSRTPPPRYTPLLLSCQEALLS